MGRLGLAVLVLVANVACTPAVVAPSAPAASPAKTDAPGVAPAAASATPPAVPATEPDNERTPSSPLPLPFIEDDYDAARAEAEKRNLPLFVDVWANWCHSCMSLKEVVFPDPKLRQLRDRFVFLSLDSENEKNQPFFAAFPNRSLPTLWVFPPKGREPLLKWIGAATAEELVSLLEGAGTGATSGEASRLFVEGNRASASARPKDAISLYRRAIAAGAKDWPDRARAVEALTMRYAETSQAKECAELAVTEAPGMPPGTPRVNVVVNGITAATRLPTSEKNRKTFETLRDLAKRIAEDPNEPILVDDRSSLYESLVSLYESADRVEARRLATAWAEMLERAAGSDATPEARRARDPHRLEAYLALGQPERAIPMLEQSEREAPDDYNPKARLARAWFSRGDVDRAASYLGRAIPLCPGPRRLRLYLFQADVMLAKKDPAAARRTLEAALAFAKEAHLSKEYAALLANIRSRLAALH